MKNCGQGREETPGQVRFHEAPAIHAGASSSDKGKQMGQYDGGQAPVDSSSWKQATGTGKGGESHPAPAPRQRNEETGLTERAPTPDPYVNGGNGYTLRNFGRGGS